MFVAQNERTTLCWDHKLGFLCRTVCPLFNSSDDNNNIIRVLNEVTNVPTVLLPFATGWLAGGMDELWSGLVQGSRNNHCPSRSVLFSSLCIFHKSTDRIVLWDFSSRPRRSLTLRCPVNQLQTITDLSPLHAVTTQRPTNSRQEHQIRGKEPSPGRRCKLGLCLPNDHKYCWCDPFFLHAAVLGSYRNSYLPVVHGLPPVWNNNITFCVWHLIDK